MRRCLLLAVLALALSLSGCNMLPGEQKDARPAPDMPVPEVTYTAPVGDMQARTQRMHTFYFVSVDGHTLVPMLRVIDIEPGMTYAEAVIESLLSTPVDTSFFQDVVPEGTQALSVESSMGFYTINLSLDARNVQSDEQMIAMLSMIVKTMQGVPGVEHVGILIGGKEDATFGLPNGIFASVDTNLTSQLSAMLTDSQRFLSQSQGGRSLDRLTALYFLSPEGTMLLPEVRAMRYTDESYVSTIVDELIKGPLDGKTHRRALPADLAVLERPPEIITTEDGVHAARISFTPALDAYIREEGIEPYLVYGSVVMSVSGFVTDIDGVVFSVGGQEMEYIPFLDQDASAYRAENGLFVREDFLEQVGAPVRIYMTDSESGMLSAVDRTLTQSAANVPRALLSALIAGPVPSEGHLRPVVPRGITDSDILGIGVEEDCVLVNLSANFYRFCQMLNAQEERNLVYAMVNTLTEAKGLSKVQFFLDGAPLDSLVGAIYLRAPLMRSPGMIR